MNSRVLQETALRYFLEVVRCGSISEASGKLNVAPSAISRQIARLESELDTLLFERRARGMVPSAAGELLAVHARHMQLEADRIGSEILALRGLQRARCAWLVQKALPWIFYRRPSPLFASATAVFIFI